MKDGLHKRVYECSDTVLIMTYKEGSGRVDLEILHKKEPFLRFLYIGSGNNRINRIIENFYNNKLSIRNNIMKALEQRKLLQYYYRELLNSIGYISMCNRHIEDIIETLQSSLQIIIASSAAIFLAGSYFAGLHTGASLSIVSLLAMLLTIGAGYVVRAPRYFYSLLKALYFSVKIEKTEKEIDKLGEEIGSILGVEYVGAFYR